jgi:hypothetical protein
VLPPLQPNGNLPPGIHEVTDWQEFVTAYGTNPHRLALVRGLEEVLRNLKAAGCKRAYIDGSYVTSKTTPGDFDACWDTVGVDPVMLDPVLLKFDNKRAAQKAKYGGELFPATATANRAGDTFLEFFQQDKSTGTKKGIVAIDLAAITI